MTFSVIEYVDKHPECGWNGVSAFVRDAVTHHPYWKRYSLETP